MIERSVAQVAVLARANAGSVSYFFDHRYADQLAATSAGACFLTEADANLAPANCAVMITAFPQAAYAMAADRLHRPRVHGSGAPAIHPTAELEDGVGLGPGVVIGPGAMIGRGTYISAGAVIGPGVAIGRQGFIGSNACVGFALIGDRVRIHAGALIGEPGFGATAGARGVVDVPQLGRVIIQDGVTIGAGSCIDRGAWEDTTIGENTKIDNLVQIAHNAVIGRNCLLAAYTGISGSVVVGDGCHLWRQGRRGRSCDHRRRRAHRGGGGGDEGCPAWRELGRIPGASAEALDAGDGVARPSGEATVGRREPAMTRQRAEVVGDIDIQEIMRRIPHRPPFLLVDRAEAYRPSQSLVGIKCVTMNEPFFMGHFPGNPVMPGVLIVEALAQTGGLLMSKSWDVDPEGKIILFMSVDNCRFRHPVRPGDVLRMEVEVQRERGDVVKFRGRGLVGDKLAAEADFAAMLVDTRK